MDEEYSDKSYHKVQKLTTKIYLQFEKSPFYSKMFKYCQNEAESIVGCLGDFIYSYELGFPKDWSLSMFTGQTDNIQRKCMYGPSFFKALPKVIYSFAKFCEANNIGKFSKNEIEDFREGVKEGYYEFYSDWEEGSAARMQFSKKFGF